MFKLLSPLVKDQTDQPTEPVSWYIIVLLHLCFLKEVFSLSLCACVLTNPITHLAQKYENLYMYVGTCTLFMSEFCAHTCQRNPLLLIQTLCHCLPISLSFSCQIMQYVIFYCDCNFFSDNFSLMQRILQRSSGLWADLYTSSKPTAQTNSTWSVSTVSHDVFKISPLLHIIRY